jgi:hypothetical protein
MCGRVRRPNKRQISLICTQPSGEITNGAAETDDRGLLEAWRARWADLVEFDVVPVIEPGEAARRANAR